jgi:hypothetical protein
MWFAVVYIHYSHATYDNTKIVYLICSILSLANVGACFVCVCVRKLYALIVHQKVLITMCSKQGPRVER